MTCDDSQGANTADRDVANLVAMCSTIELEPFAEANSFTMVTRIAFCLAYVNDFGNHLK